MEEEPRRVDGRRSRRGGIEGNDFVAERRTCPAEEKGVRSSERSRAIVCVCVVLAITKYAIVVMYQ